VKRMIMSFFLAIGLALCISQTLGAEQKHETLEDVVEEEVWIIFAHDPAGYFHDAWENIIVGNLQDAAYHIRRAKAWLKLEACRAETEAKEDLEASTKELEELIKALEEGSHPTSKTLKAAFAKAEYALSNHHHQKALGYGGS